MIFQTRPPLAVTSRGEASDEAEALPGFRSDVDSGGAFLESGASVDADASIDAIGASIIGAAGAGATTIGAITDAGATILDAIIVVPRATAVGGSCKGTSRRR